MWFLALRQLTARKKQSLLVTGGILLGTATFIGFSGIMLGFQNYMIDRLINSGGHIHISAREKDITREGVEPALYHENTLVSWIKAPSGRRDYAHIDHPAGWFERLTGNSDVLAYSPQLTIQALAKRGSISTSVSVIGVEPSRQSRVTNINQFIKTGSLEDIGRTGNRMIVGKGLLSKLGSAIGENVLLTSASGGNAIFRVIGTFEVGIPTVDNVTVYASLADVQKLNKTPSQISDILLRLTRVELAAPLAQQFVLFSQDKVESWEQANQGILSVFNMQTVIRNLTSFCILLVAGFGIYNVLNMIVNQKKREIGILRSMGYTGSEVSQLFLIQGFLFGAAGGTLGLLMGYLLSRYVSTLHIGVPGSIDYRPMIVAYDWQIYVKAFVLAQGASILAGWIPARSAGKMNPIDIVRTEGG